MKKTLIIGCGYLGKRIAHNLRETGIEVCGTTRSEARAAELEADGIPAALLELETAGEAAALEGDTSTTITPDSVSCSRKRRAMEASKSSTRIPKE